MATKKVNVCSVRRCGHREPAGLLFDALFDIQQGRSKCSKCNSKSYLELEFEFDLGKSSHLCKVLDVFLPKKIDHWKRGKSVRWFYPFLVVVESIDKRDNYRSIWLPYWHVDKNKKTGKQLKKYGQWASFVWEEPFISLIRQAKAKGYKF